LEQEGVHPLTGQRAANFRLLANQWVERRLVTQWQLTVFYITKLDPRFEEVRGGVEPWLMARWKARVDADL